MKWRQILALSLVGSIGAIAGYQYARIDAHAISESGEPSVLELAVHDRGTALDGRTSPLLIEVENTQRGFNRARLVYERVAELSVAEAASLASSISNAAHSSARSAILIALIERLVDADAGNAQRFFHAHIAPTDPAFQQLFSAWYRAWLDAEQDEAIRYARAISDPMLRDAALQLAIERVGAETPIANQLFAALSDTARAAATAARANRLSPVAAFEASLVDANPARRFQLLQSAFARLLNENALHAFAQIERIPDDEREVIVNAALAKWAEREPMLALRQLDRAELPVEYRAAMLGALAERNPHQALEWLQRNDYEQPTQELHRAVVPELLNTDVSIAARAVADMRERAPVDLIQQVAVAQAERDPQQAFAWTAGLAYRSQSERQQALQAVSASFVVANPDAAAAYVDRVVDAEIKAGLLREIASHKAHRSVQESWTWLTRYRSEPTYRENARALLSQWSFAKPQEVADVVRSIDDAEFQRAVAEQLASVWRQRDNEAFRHWLASLPVGHLRDALLSLEQNSGS